MEEDDKGGALNTNMNGLLKIAIFSMVAVIIVSTVAVPILSNVGTTTKMEYNEGVRVTDIFEKYGDRLSAEDDSKMLIYGGDGVTLLYDTDKRINIIEKSEIDANYPVALIWQHLEGSLYIDDWIYVTYDSSNDEYTSHSTGGQAWGTHTWDGDSNSGMSIFGGHYFVQDPKGDYVLTHGSIRYSEGNTHGVTMDAGHLLWIDNGNATMRTWNGSYFGTLSSGDAVYNQTESDGIYTLTGMVFSTVPADWLIGPKGVSTTENYIDGTQIGTLISIIPILIIAGIIVAIIKGKSMSDR